jgi:hypothetical protein
MFVARSIFFCNDVWWFLFLNYVLGLSAKEANSSFPSILKTFPKDINYETKISTWPKYLNKTLVISFFTKNSR